MNGADVDDAATLLFRCQFAHERLRDKEWRLQVDPDDAIELLFLCIQKRCVAFDAGVVDENVRRAERQLASATAEVGVEIFV